MAYSRYSAGSDTDFDYKFTCTDFMEDGQTGNLGTETCWDSQDYKFTDSLGGAAGKVDMSCKDNEYVRAISSRYDSATRRT
jgi:hypothetical protein